MKRAKTKWHVVCELGTGLIVGDCGHAHRTTMAAVLCTYEPAAFKRDPAAGLYVRPIVRPIGRTP